MADPATSTDADPVRHALDLSLELEKLLRDVTDVYGPVATPGESKPAPGPKERPLSAGRGAPLVPPGQPDRLVTYPLWVFWVVAIHLIVGVAQVGTIACGTAILYLLAEIIDSAADTWVLRASAVTLGAAAAVGTVLLTIRSLLQKARACPW